MTQQPAPDPDQFFTLDEAAVILKVSVDTLRRQISDDLIPFRKVGSQYRLPAWWVRLDSQVKHDNEPRHAD